MLFLTEFEPSRYYLDPPKKEPCMRKRLNCRSLNRRTLSPPPAGTTPFRTVTPPRQQSAPQTGLLRGRRRMPFSGHAHPGFCFALIFHERGSVCPFPIETAGEFSADYQFLSPARWIPLVSLFLDAVPAYKVKRYARVCRIVQLPAEETQSFPSSLSLDRMRGDNLALTVVSTRPTSAEWNPPQLWLV